MKKVFRQIHLWLSVPFGVVITLICLSGSMLVFEKELTELCRPELYRVDHAGERPLPVDSLMTLVSATLPDSVEAVSITVSPEPGRTWQVGLSAPRRASLYVDPYTGEVRGRSAKLPFFDTMMHLHRWLLGKSQAKGGGTSVGKLLVGVSTLVLVVILLTGLLMWLTNRRKPLVKSLTISLTKGWPRFWHDLHVAGGIYATVFLLALALTGLTWSFPWYRSGFYSLFGAGSEEQAYAGGHGHGRGGDAHGGRPGSRGDGKGRHGHRAAVDSTAVRGAHPVADTIRGEAAAGERGHRHGDGEDRATRRSTRERPQARAAHTAPAAAPETMPDTLSLADAGAESPVTAEAGGEEGHAYHGGDGEHRRGGGEHRRGGRGGRRGHGEGWAYHHHEGEEAAAEEPREPEMAAEEPAPAAAERVPRRGGRPEHRAEPASRRDRAEAHRHRPHRDTLAAAPAVADTVPAAVLCAPYAKWQQVYDSLAASHPGYRQIVISDGEAGVVPAGRRSLRATDRYEFDPQTGALGACRPYADQSASAKLRGAVYTVHVGSWGGWPTRILTFLSALLGATLPLTGYYLWIRRLRNKKTHAGAKP